VLLGVLALATGFGVGLGLAEAPSNVSQGPVPSDPTSVSSFWIGPSTQPGWAPSSSAVPLAADIDRAPAVAPGVYHCPVGLDQDAVVLMFAYASGRPVTASVAVTGCAWVRVGPLTIPSDNPGRGHAATRWITKKLRANLVALGAPPWARRWLTG
jgi:hypothetical protein